MATHTVYDTQGNVLSVVQLPEPEPSEEQQRIAALEDALAVLAADMLGGGA